MNNIKKGVYNPGECFMSSWKQSGHIMKLTTFMKQRYGVTPEEYTISIEKDDFFGAYIKFQGKHDLASNALSKVRIPIRPMALKDIELQPIEFILDTAKIWKFEHRYTKSIDNKPVTYRSTNVRPIYVAVLDSTSALSSMELYNVDI